MSIKKLPDIGNKMSTYNANWHIKEKSEIYQLIDILTKMILPNDDTLYLLYAEQKYIIHHRAFGPSVLY